jgi:proteasome accessory factor C
LIKLPLALSATPIINQEVSSAVAEALNSRSALEITYHSLYRDEISSRIILPIEIVVSDGQNYLSSYCYTASDFRQFRIDRIQAASVQAVPQAIPKVSVQQLSYSCTIKVFTPTREIAERFKQSELPINSEFDFQTYSIQWIQRSVMASGSAIGLQSPPDVRKSIAVLAQSMLDRYKAG